MVLLSGTAFLTTSKDLELFLGIHQCSDQIKIGVTKTIKSRTQTSFCSQELYLVSPRGIPEITWLHSAWTNWMLSEILFVSCHQVQETHNENVCNHVNGTVLNEFFMLLSSQTNGAAAISHGVKLLPLMLWHQLLSGRQTDGHYGRPLLEGYIPPQVVATWVAHAYVHYLWTLHCSSAWWPLASILPTSVNQLQNTSGLAISVFTTQADKSYTNMVDLMHICGCEQ